MSQSVSVPEKALEHWSSQYVAYRYRSKAAQWWPARGEDIDVGWLPAKPGKAVQLELKTTTVSGPGIHDVFVDLGQLFAYRQRPLGRQPFYVFPQPDWCGSLAAAASAHGRPVTELGFGRSGRRWWFADWMVCMPAADVAAVLQDELDAHGSPERKKARLVRFDLTGAKAGLKPVWGSGAASPPTFTWREFWSKLEQCGEPGWPQLIRVPKRAAQDRLPRRVAVGLLREAADRLAAGEWDTGEPLVTLEPDGDGYYQIAPPSVAEPSPQADGTGRASDNRQVVFLEARALFRR